MGDPDCAAFYAWILHGLKAITSKSHVPTGEVTNATRGNLGEFITHAVLRQSGLNGPGYTPLLAGAVAPLAVGAVTGLDLTFVYLDPGGVVANDCLYVIEVKTTEQPDLSYSSRLIDDYQKLFDSTKPSTTLSHRMSFIKGKLLLELNFSEELVERVEALFSNKPEHCVQIKILPTLVHDRSPQANAVHVLDGVAARIHQLGWPKLNIEMQSISLNRLNDCLENLASLKSFAP